jgi:aminoglycoside 3-N-acetyltransferase I
MLICQRLQANDVDAVQAVRQLYAHAFELPELEPVPEGHLQSLLSNPAVTIWVARAQGQVVGAITTYTLPMVHSVRPLVYWYDVAVHEAWRRQGVATQLAEYVFATVRAEAAPGTAVEFLVQTEADDDPARLLYLKLGFTESHGSFFFQVRA